MLTAIIILAALAALFFGITYFAFRYSLGVTKKNQSGMTVPKSVYGTHYEQKLLNNMKDISSRPCEEVYITSHDGLKLGARLFMNGAENAPLAVFFHGYRSSALRDCSGGYYIWKRYGFNVLAVCQRAHGLSEGSFLTMGVEESRDVISWLNYANERFGKDTPILLAGLSMGAATVMMSLSRGLPDNVLGISADCGYTSPKEILKKVIAQMKLPTGIIYPLIRLGGKIYGGFDLEEVSAIEAVSKNTQFPLLLIHGEADDFVPCEMSKRCYEACPAKKVIMTVPNAGHGLAFYENEQQYYEMFEEFFGDIFGITPDNK